MLRLTSCLAPLLQVVVDRSGQVYGVTPCNSPALELRQHLPITAALSGPQAADTQRKYLEVGVGLWGLLAVCCLAHVLQPISVREACVGGHWWASIWSHAGDALCHAATPCQRCPHTSTSMPATY